MKLAGVPLNATAVAPVKFVPSIVTLMPTAPLCGVKSVIVGGCITVKLPALVAVPPGPVTLSGPLAAPAGTVAWIAVSDATENDAAVPLNATAVAFVKFVPVIVTLAPSIPLAGVKSVITGGMSTVNAVALVADPPDAVTPIGPDVAPTGTVA